MNTIAFQTFLSDQNINLEFTPAPGGSYVPVNVRGNVAYVAIQFPILESGLFVTGRLGKDLQTQEGYEAARIAAINTLAQINKAIGFEKIDGLNHVDVYYQSDLEWDEAPIVANGASDLFVNALGTHGIHTRSLVGVYKLPRNFVVGITASFTLL